MMVVKAQQRGFYWGARTPIAAAVCLHNEEPKKRQSISSSLLAERCNLFSGLNVCLTTYRNSITTREHILVVKWHTSVLYIHTYVPTHSYTYIRGKTRRLRWFSEPQHTKTAKHLRYGCARCLCFFPRYLLASHLILIQLWEGSFWNSWFPPMF